MREYCIRYRTQAAHFYRDRDIDVNVRRKSFASSKALSLDLSGLGKFENVWTAETSQCQGPVSGKNFSRMQKHWCMTHWEIKNFSSRKIFFCQSLGPGHTGCGSPFAQILHAYPLMLFASCVNVPIDCSVFHNLCTRCCNVLRVLCERGFNWPFMHKKNICSRRGMQDPRSDQARIMRLKWFKPIHGLIITEFWVIPWKHPLMVIKTWSFRAVVGGWITGPQRPTKKPGGYS